MINELKAKRNMVQQASSQIETEVEKQKLEAESDLQTKNEIESGFKKYIQNMNDAATNILRDYEENVKVKQIWTIVYGKKEWSFTLAKFIKIHNRYAK